MKLISLDIKNFGCIGPSGVRIIIDNIVILIGPNNVGKSTVLKAYEAFSGTGEALDLECFHKESQESPIEIIGTFIQISDDDKEKIGRKWLYTDEEFGESVRVKWQWNKPNEKGHKFSWSQESNGWISGGMGGFDSLISSCVPTPLKINPTDKPKDMEDKIIEILTEAIKKTIKDDSNKISGMILECNKLAEEVSKEVSSQLDEACTLLKEKLHTVFPEHEVMLEPKAGKIEPEKIIGAGSQIRIKEPSGGDYPLAQQGTGLQRTFLWSCLGTLAEIGRMKKGKKIISAAEPRILLIEEPEVFLHPPAIRAARESLYNLAEVPGWQIIVTTHSPIFIDVSKPHTTIIRVEKTSCETTKIFSTDKVAFDGDERDRLKMIRVCHPTVNEFFFTDYVILVEGETEQAVLSHFASEEVGSSVNIHIVNCMGKANIPLFARILNHFGTPYTILHDSDSPKVERSNKWITNAMWTVNETIVNVVSERNRILPSSSIIVHIPDFEQYYFGHLQKGDKPYSALREIMASQFETEPKYENLRKLLKQIIDGSHPFKYNSIEKLKEFLEAYKSMHNPTPNEMWTFS